MTARSSLSKKIRFEVFKRDGFSCQYCGATPPAVLEVDHIIAVSSGGENNMDNLVTSCFDCNRGKSDKSLNLIPEPLKDKALRIKESEAQLIEYSAILREKAERLEDDTWEIILKFEPACEKFNNRWFSSIKRQIERIGIFEVEDAMDIAVSKFGNIRTSTIKYFHGICRNKANEGDEL